MEKSKVYMLEEKRNKIAREVVDLLAGKNVTARDVFRILELAKDISMDFMKMS